jgi:hypothetical protein
MEPSDLEASPRGHPCTVHGWGPCPTWVAPVRLFPSSGQQGEGKGEEDGEDPVETSMVPPLQQGPRTRHTAWKIVGPRGHPRETLALPGPTTTITSEASPSAAPVVLTPPSNQVGPSGTGSPPDWLEKYVRQLGDPLAGPFCYPIPSHPGRAPGAWGLRTRP